MATPKELEQNFRRGLKKGFLYYMLGTILTCLTYMLFGWGYRHAPGLHHFVAFLFLLGGVVWTLYYFILLVIGHKLKVNFGVLTIHIIVILSVALYIWTTW